MRRRLLAAILIIASTLGFIAWLDAQLLLRNPAELDARVRLLLARVFPTQRPTLRHVDLDLANTRCIIEGFSLAEKGDEAREMLSVRRVEISFSLSEWLSPREIVVEGVSAKIRRDRAGKVNVLEAFSGPAASGPSSPRGPEISSSEVLIAVTDARIEIEDEQWGIHVLASSPGARLTLHPDGSITGKGKAQAGALVPHDSPFAGSGRPVANEPEVLYCDVVPFLDFELDRRPEGALALPLYAQQVRVGPLLRSILPPYVRDEIWDELNPTGLVDARVTLRIANSASAGLGWGVAITPELSLRPEVYVHAKGATLRPKGFPYPIRDISGRFEVAPGVVAWEDVTARTNEEGTIARGRGSFFLGSDAERVTLFVSLIADKVPFDESLRAAMPPDIREVYDQFSIRGRSGPSRVTVFKSPDMEEPQLSIASTLTGEQSAAFVDYPVRFTARSGTFVLREGGNVEIEASGGLEGGGTADVHARVVQGDLIHVHVEGKEVPLLAETIAKLDPEVRRMIVPFHPAGGRAGFDIHVEKADPAAKPLPRVVAFLEGVEVCPDQFPYRMRTDGRLEVTPRPARHGEPAHVRVDLALTASGPALAATVVSGTVILDPARDGEFKGELEARCERLDLTPEIRAATPPEIREVFDRLAPAGSLEDVTAHVRSIHSFDARGKGRDLTASLDAFPYRVQVDDFAIAHEGRAIELRRVEGRTGGYGRFSLAGRLELPPEGAGGPTEPLVQVSVVARDVALEPSLVAALPPDAREPIAKLDPRGRVDADLHVELAPALAPDITGRVAIAGARVLLDRLDPMLEGLAGEPIEALEGVIRLDGERAWLEGLRGRFRNAPVSLAGFVVTAPAGSAAVASAARPVTVDLVSHVDGLLLDETSRRLARGPVLQSLNRFPVEGRCDLDFHVRRAGEQNLVDVRVRPRGVRVVPKLLPFAFDDVRGTIEVSEGEPAYVELTARLGQAEIVVRRDQRLESFAPAGSSIFRVRARGLTPSELIERGAPEDFAKMVRDMDLRGTLDLAVDVAVPADERGRQRFLAELRTRATPERQGLSLTTGLRFEDLDGTLRVAGSVAKFEPLELAGALALRRATWKRQEIKDALFPVTMRNGIVSIGTNANYFVASVYGGQLRGSVDMDLRNGPYSGRLYLENAQLSRAANELVKLSGDAPTNEPKSGGLAPVKGTFVAKLDFRGGGVSPGPDRTPIGISGEGAIRAQNANLVDVPLLLGTLPDIVRGVARGDSSYDPKSFDRLYAKIRLKPTHVALDLVRLDSDTLTLAGKDGRLAWEGDVKLDLLPFKTGAIFDDLFKQFVGVSVRGKISEPSIQTLPFSNSVVRVWDAIKELFSAPEDRIGESVPGE